jgi:hypothetical protein
VYIACHSPLLKFPAVEIVTDCRNFQKIDVSLERGDVVAGVHCERRTHIKTISEKKPRPVQTTACGAAFCSAIRENRISVADPARRETETARVLMLQMQSNSQG